MALLESRAPQDPWKLFLRWFREAQRAGAPQPDAMTLATAGDDRRPSARMVLFKGLDGGSFVFYWSVTRHQVRVSGTVRRLSRAASQAYFHSRPRGAQLSALASRQSRVVVSRAVLERAVADLDRRHPDDVPLPSDWGGYALRPAWIEFWENRTDRLHDRLRYVRLPGGAWRTERLAP